MSDSNNRTERWPVRWLEALRTFLLGRVTDRSVRRSITAEHSWPQGAAGTSWAIYSAGIKAVHAWVAAVDRSRRQRRRAMQAVMQSADHLTEALTVHTRLLQAPGREDTIRHAAEVRTARLQGPEKRSGAPVPRLAYYGVLLVVAVVDTLFFVRLYRDLFDEGASWWTVDTVVAVFMALVTPLAVWFFADQGGTWLALRRYRARLDDDARGEADLPGPLGPVSVIAIAVLTAVFGFTAWWRFTAETQQVGAAPAPTLLLGVLFAVLPPLALLAAASALDPRDVRDRRLLHADDVRRGEEHDAEDGVRRADAQLTEIWRGGTHALSRLVDAGNAAILHVEEIVADVYADTGRVGGEVELRTMSGVPEELLSGDAEDYRVPALVQQRNLGFALPAWILDEVAQDRQLLLAHRPQAVRERFVRASSVVSAGSGIESAPVSADHAGDPEVAEGVELGEQAAEAETEANAPAVPVDEPQEVAPPSPDGEDGQDDGAPRMHLV